MLQQVGDAVVSAIEEVSISSSSSDDEIDLIDENSNIVLSSEDDAEEIEISFVLVDEETVTVEEQKERLKEIINKSVDKNYFRYLDEEGWISVEDVSIPQSGDLKNIRRGTVSGFFLPFPKHYSDAQKSILFFGEIDTSLEMEADVIAGTAFSGEIDVELSSTGKLDVGKILSTDVNGTFSFTSLFGAGSYGDDEYGEEGVVLNLLKSISSSINSSLTIKSGLYSTSYGLSYTATEPQLSISLVLQGTFDFALTSSANLEKKSEIGYGFDYGGEYAVLIFDYSSQLYGTGIYGE